MPLCAYGNISAPAGTGSGTRTVFLDAEENPDGHSSLRRVRTNRYLGRDCQIPRGKAECRSGASGRKSASPLAPDAETRAPEAKQTAAVALPVGRPLSLAPDAHGHSAASPPSRSRMPAGTGTAAEASSGGGYAVAVASERSAADADAVFRSLQAKFPNQLGGREPIVRRTDLGPEGIYYRASIGPFVSMKAAAKVCSSLKAAGESCLVEKN